jgi:hypothetical protein
LSGKEGTGVAGTGQVIGDDRDGHGFPVSYHKEPEA